MRHTLVACVLVVGACAPEQQQVSDKQETESVEVRHAKASAKVFNQRAWRLEGLQRPTSMAINLSLVDTADDMRRDMSVDYSHLRWSSFTGLMATAPGTTVRFIYSEQNLAERSDLPHLENPAFYLTAQVSSFAPGKSFAQQEIERKLKGILIFKVLGRPSGENR